MDEDDVFGRVEGFDVGGHFCSRSKIRQKQLHQHRMGTERNEGKSRKPDATELTNSNRASSDQNDPVRLLNLPLMLPEVLDTILLLRPRHPTRRLQLGPSRENERVERELVRGWLAVESDGSVEFEQSRRDGERGGLDDEMRRREEVGGEGNEGLVLGSRRDGEAGVLRGGKGRIQRGELDGRFFPRQKF